ncbi:MAG: hypothetical protein JWM47_769 [Acidimicrobiales bacterium]|nr:hypothetical protein [Acidimicrobiales bacterium]
MVLAGKPIADGFTVPAGAVLAGSPVFTASHSGAEGATLSDNGWSAYLLVTGDPRAVVEDIRAQAEALDLGVLPFTGYDPRTFCATDRSAYRCIAEGYARGKNHRSLRLALLRQPASKDQPPQSHLVLTYANSDAPLPADLASMVMEPGDGAPGPEPPPVPTRWSPLPAAGEQFSEGAAEGLNRLVLEPGSRLLLPIARNADHYPEETALLSIDRSSAEVLAAYVRQAARHVGYQGLDPVRQIHRARPGPTGTRITTAGVGDPDAAWFDFRLVEHPDGRALLRIVGSIE